MIPNYEDFCQLIKDYNVIPVWEEIEVICDNPISLYQKLSRDDENTYLLESVEGGQNLARYSFIGLQPYADFQAKGEDILIECRGKKQQLKGNPLDVLADYMAQFKAPDLADLPRFAGGAVGYLSYDTIRYIEKIPCSTTDDLELPDMFFTFPEHILVYDHVTLTLKIIVNLFVDEKIDPADLYATAKKAISRIKEKIEKVQLNVPAAFQGRKPLEIKSNFTDADFCRAVSKAKEYILAGDIFQVGLSQRFSAEIEADALSIYRALRRINPSPYMYYLNYQKMQIIGSSPELLICVEDKDIITRPIAGTRPRGKTKQQDRVLEEELLRDEKERAEHVMLVDLHRNDLGRVCEYGSVKLDKFMTIERYSHVMHIVSDIIGTLRAEVDALSALKYSFPAGTVSGAPKIRAMEIIEELEPYRRGVYAGAVCYLSFQGNLDSCIAIRTIVLKDKTAYVQAGAGIVADSVPEMEYQETKNKAGALLQALRMANGELD